MITCNKQACRVGENRATFHGIYVMVNYLFDEVGLTGCHMSNIAMLEVWSLVK